MVILNFGASNYVKNAPGVKLKDTTISIPESGDIPSVDDIISSISSRFSREDMQKLVPKISAVQGYTSVKISKPSGLSGGTSALWILWIPERTEWMELYHESWLESSAWGDDWSFSGPYRLPEGHAGLILGAYGISVPQGLIDAGGVTLAHISPSKLEKIAAEQK